MEPPREVPEVPCSGCGGRIARSLVPVSAMRIALPVCDKVCALGMSRLISGREKRKRAEGMEETSEEEDDEEDAEKEKKKKEEEEEKQRLMEAFIARTGYTVPEFAKTALGTWDSLTEDVKTMLVSRLSISDIIHGRMHLLPAKHTAARTSILTSAYARLARLLGHSEAVVHEDPFIQISALLDRHDFLLYKRNGNTPGRPNVEPRGMLPFLSVKNGARSFLHLHVRDADNAVLYGFDTFLPALQRCIAEGAKKGGSAGAPGPRLGPNVCFRIYSRSRLKEETLRENEVWYESHFWWRNNWRHIPGGPEDKKGYTIWDPVTTDAPPAGGVRYALNLRRRRTNPAEDGYCVTLSSETPALGPYVSESLFSWRYLSEVKPLGKEDTPVVWVTGMIDEECWSPCLEPPKPSPYVPEVWTLLPNLSYRRSTMPEFGVRTVTVEIFRCRPRLTTYGERDYVLHPYHNRFDPNTPEWVPDDSNYETAPFASKTVTVNHVPRGSGPRTVADVHIVLYAFGIRGNVLFCRLRSVWLDNASHGEGKPVRIVQPDTRPGAAPGVPVKDPVRGSDTVVYPLMIRTDLEVRVSPEDLRKLKGLPPEVRPRSRLRAPVTFSTLNNVTIRIEPAATRRSDMILGTILCGEEGQAIGFCPVTDAARCSTRDDAIRVAIGESVVGASIHAN